MIRRTSRIAAHVFGSLLTAAMIVAIAIGVRLSIGPISLGFVTPMIEDAFVGNSAGLNVSVGDTILTWSGIDNDIALQIVGIELTGTDGVRVARLPSAGIDLSVRGLLAGELAPSGITLAGADITIRRDGEGVVRLGFGGASAGEAASPGEGSAIADVLTLLRRGPGNSPTLRRLERISIVRSRLEFDDELTGRRWVGNPMGGELLRGEGGEVDLNFGAAITSAGETVSLRLSGAVPPGADQDARLSLRFGNLVPALFDAAGRVMGMASSIVMPLDGEVGAVIGADGGVRSVSFDVEGGKGGLDLPALFPEGLTLDRLAVAGRYSVGDATLTLDRMALARGDVALSASGRAAFPAAGAALDLTAKIAGLPVDDIGPLWPVSLSVNGRRWIMQNIRGGHIHDGVFRVKAAPGDLDAATTPDDLLSGDFVIEGTATSFMAGLPPVSGMKARAHMTADAIDVAIESGAVDMGEAGKIALQGGSARVYDFTKKDQMADISFTADGPVKAALSLLDLPPLGYAAKLGIDPAKVGGSHQTTARFQLPLVANLDLDNLLFSTKSVTSALSLPAIVGPLDLTDGQITFAVDQTKAAGAGKAKLGGIPLDLDWTESFNAAPGKPSTRLSAKGTLDDGFLRGTLGIDPGQRLVGTVPTQVTLTGRGSTIMAIDTALDLGAAAIAVPELGFSKKAGVPGSLALKVVPGDGRFRLDAIEAKTEGLDLAGSVDLTSAGDLLGVALTRARLGASNFSLDFRRPALDKRYALKFRGSMVDLSAYFEEKSPDRRPEAERPDPSAPDGLPDFDFDVALDRLQLGNKVAFTGIKAAGSHALGRWQTIDGRAAQGNSKAEAVIKLVPAPGGRKLTVVAGDAGALVRAGDVYSDFEGGTLALDAVIDDTKPNRPMTGHVVMRKFKVVKAPVLARILTLGSLTGIADAIGGEGITMDALQADIVQESAVVRILKAKAYGDSIGLTLSGTFDTWARSISVGGTIVPSYGLNRIIGSIPLVGDILTGGEGGGLFAFNYSVVGPVEDPQVMVNPLSVLAPGILRDIISAIDGSDSAAGAAAPPVIDVPEKPKTP